MDYVEYVISALQLGIKTGGSSKSVENLRAYVDKYHNLANFDRRPNDKNEHTSLKMQLEEVTPDEKQRILALTLIVFTECLKEKEIFNDCTKKEWISKVTLAINGGKPDNQDSPKIKPRWYDSLTLWEKILGFVGAVVGLISAIIVYNTAIIEMPTPTPTLPMTLAVTTARTGTPETITIGPPNTSTMTPAVSVTSSPRPTTPIPPRDMIAFASGIYSLLTIDNQTRLVQIDAFAIDPHEVTRADFRPFAENPANSTPATRERLLQTVMNNNDLPVVNVTYDEARAYCQLIGKDLPTADQWTLAAGWNPSEARINRYAWGLDEINTNYTNMDNRLGRVISVMTLPPNAAGLYEMGGNAAEWVLSEAVDDYRAYGGDYLAPYSSGHVAHFDRYDRPDPALEMARIGFRCVQNS